MKGRASLAIFIAVIISLSSASSLYASEMKTAKPRLAERNSKSAKTKRGTVSGKLNAKVDKFLRNILKARSLDEVSRAYKMTRFLKAEKKYLEKELKKAPYSRKLRSLEKKAEAKARAKVEAKARRLIKQKKSELKKREKQKLRHMNKRAQMKLKNMKSRQRALSERRPSSSVQLRSPTTGMIRRFRSDIPLTDSRIVSIHPQPAVVGQNLTINGENLGTDGRIALRIGGLTVICGIGNWEPSRIVVNIPSGLESIVGEIEKDGRVWIYNERNVMATGAVRVGPDLARMHPLIRSLSSETIMPGQDLSIEGENFLTERRGTVQFEFGSLGMTIRSNILYWDNTSILVRFPEIGRGLRSAIGEVLVRNHAGLETSQRIDLVGSSGVETLTEVRTVSGGVDWLMGHSGGEALSYDFFDFDLSNGWVVVGSDLYYESTHSSSIVYWETRPHEESTNPRSTLKGAVYSGSYITFAVIVLIEGPLGTHYR